MIARVAVLTAALVMTCAGVLAADELQYKKRTSFCEGLKPEPSSKAFDLIAVEVDYESDNPRPDTMAVTFNPSGATDVYLTVREKTLVYYYWLDQVDQAAYKQVNDHWRQFAWPTAPVLKRLDKGESRIPPLGALVRIGYSEPTEIEVVAPALLHDRRDPLPDSVRAYLFTFKTNYKAVITPRLLNEADAEIDAGWERQMSLGTGVHVIRWNCRNTATGNYRLVLTGYLVHNNQRVRQTIRFRHEPVLR